MDEDTTTLRHNFDDSTQIVVNPIEVDEVSKEGTEFSDEIIKGNRKTARTAASVAVGGAVLGTTASVIINGSAAETATEDIGGDSDSEELEIQPKVVELPEIIVEALGRKHEEIVNDNISEVEIAEVIPNTETIYAELSSFNPERTDYVTYAHIRPEEHSTAPITDPSVESSYGLDIPVISVGNEPDDESSLQILGVTLDESTGNHTGYQTADADDLDVIDVLGGIGGSTDFMDDPLIGDAPDYLSEIMN